MPKRSETKVKKGTQKQEQTAFEKLRKDLIWSPSPTLSSPNGRALCALRIQEPRIQRVELS
jgi:hypothetical protein